ncbi:MAG TPA: O-antigen ligase family protein [Vicinamibacterales bacterium]|nr:O-antigen ligase family protein [Vicinamibacterales bacterium]
MYLRTLAVPALLCAVLLVMYRPRPDLRDRGSADVWLSAAFAFELVQLVPLPERVAGLLSPHARGAWERLALAVPRTLPLSLDVAGGIWAAIVAGCALATFITARHVFANGGVRRVVRAIASIGLIVSAIGLAQEATGGGLMYWRWRPIEEGADPFGPFVNRNHFGTWVVLAVPLVLGYLAAHAAVHHRASGGERRWSRLRDLTDSRTIWLTAAVVFMIVALAVTLSRSALFGLGAALALAAWLRPAGGGTTGRRPERWVAAGLLLAAAAALVRVDPSALGARLAAAPISIAGRIAIWRDTLPVVRDFWLTGTGAGTYETVMLLYQRSALEVRFNQAHNHYLQLAAEGGLLLGIPLLMGLSAWLRAAAAAMRRDTSAMYYVRAGACCGLAGAAAQSVWETGVTTPANALLAAVLAAIVVHAPIRADRQGGA